jgi:hypothetical protein
MGSFNGVDQVHPGWGFAALELALVFVPGPLGNSSACRL